MKNSKRYITLLEIMIVIFLISIIGSVVGYNMKGSIDRGKAFRTAQAIDQINDVLLLEATKDGRSLEDLATNALDVLQKSDIVKDPSSLIKDGWGDPLDIQPDNENHCFIITSKNLDAYNLRHVPIKKEQEEKNNKKR